MESELTRNFEADRKAEEYKLDTDRYECQAANILLEYRQDENTDCWDACAVWLVNLGQTSTTFLESFLLLFGLLLTHKLT